MRAPRDGTRRAGRRAAWGLVALLLLAVALRFAVNWRAAAVVTANLRQAAATAGFRIDLPGSPVISLGGFRLAGIVLRDANGREVATVEALKGRVAFVAHEPHVELSVDASGVRISPPLESMPSGPWNLPAFPLALVSVALHDARVDLGAGKFLGFDADVGAEAEGRLRVVAAGLDYADGATARKAEDLAVTLRLSGVEPEPEVTDEWAGLRADVAVTAGALSAGPIRVDFAADPARLTGILMPTIDGKVRGTDLTLALGRLLKVSGRVELGADASVGTSDFTVLAGDLGRTFESLLRAPFAREVSVFEDAAVDGRAQWMVHLRSPSRVTADSALTVNCPRVKLGPFEADSFNMSLPWIGQAMIGRQKRAGFLRASALRAFGRTWSGLDLALEAVPGRLRSPADHEWVSGPASVRVGDLEVEDRQEGGFRVGANVRIEGFDFDLPGNSVGAPVLASVLRGDLGRVFVDSEALEATGPLDLVTAEGSLRLRNLVVRNPWSPGASVAFDADVALRERGDAAPSDPAATSTVQVGGGSEVVLVEDIAARLRALFANRAATDPASVPPPP